MTQPITIRRILSCHQQIAFLVTVSLLLAPMIHSRELTIKQAQEIAVKNTARGKIIVGKREVAEQNYRAKRINFLVPEISINGSLPSYNVDENFRFFGGANQKQLYKTRDFTFNSFVELKQSLFTGGKLTITANLTSDDSRYPDTRNFDINGLPIPLGTNVSETRNQGSFNFELDQPLFRPSSTKKELHDRRDDMEVARISQFEETTSLLQDVTDAYVSVLSLELDQLIQGDKLKSRQLKAIIDSSKFDDGIITEETWLGSASELLDAELEQVDVETQYTEKKRELATFLDISFEEVIEVVEPKVTNHFDAVSKEALINNWESSIAIKKAEYEYDKSLRQAGFSAAGNGLTGDLKASYSFGKGDVVTEREDGFNSDNDIDTKGWGISLNVRLPVWDGGAGGASVKASQFASEQARLELDQVRKNARTVIVNLVNDLDVSYRRLDVIRRQIVLSKSRLDIAQLRYDDGQISEITYLDARIFQREQENRYLKELKQYLLNRIELDGKFAIM